MAMTCAYVNFTLLDRIDGLPVGAALLMTLEIEGRIRQLEGKRFVAS